jgi:hypothetical protein
MAFDRSDVAPEDLRPFQRPAVPGPGAAGRTAVPEPIERSQVAGRLGVLRGDGQPRPRAAVLRARLPTGHAVRPARWERIRASMVRSAHRPLAGCSNIFHGDHSRCGRHNPVAAVSRRGD